MIFQNYLIVNRKILGSNFFLFRNLIIKYFLKGTVAFYSFVAIWITKNPTQYLPGKLRPVTWIDGYENSLYMTAYNSSNFYDGTVEATRLIRKYLKEEIQFNKELKLLTRVMSTFELFTNVFKEILTIVIAIIIFIIFESFLDLNHEQHTQDIILLIILTYWLISQVMNPLLEINESLFMNIIIDLEKNDGDRDQINDRIKQFV